MCYIQQIPLKELKFITVERENVTLEGREKALLTIHLQHMCLAQVLVAVGVAAVVAHVDGRHLGDVQGAVVPKVLQQEGRVRRRQMREIGGGKGGSGCERRCGTAGGDGESEARRKRGP